MLTRTNNILSCMQLSTLLTKAAFLSRTEQRQPPGSPQTGQLGQQAAAAQRMRCSTVSQPGGMVSGTSSSSSLHSEPSPRASSQLSAAPSSSAAFAVSSRTCRPCMCLDPLHGQPCIRSCKACRKRLEGQGQGL